MPRFILPALVAAVVLLLIPGWAAAGLPSALVGRYQMEVHGGDVLELRADGSASLAGEETRWTAKGNLLTVGTDSMVYQMAGGKLLLNMGGLQLSWKKLGSSGNAPQAGQATPDFGYGNRRKPGTTLASPDITPLPRYPAQATGTSQDAEARQLLMSSAWCSFTYNKISGASTTRKAVFHPNGVLSLNGGAETYSSGYGGSYAGQSSSSGSMRWKFRNLRLYIDQGDGEGFQDTNLTAEKNSSGWPILHVDGREYSMCK